MKLLNEVCLLTLDTETSGLEPGVHSPVEVGWVMTQAGNLLVAGESLVNPGHPITNGAKAIHHILDEDVAGAPDLMTVLKTRIGPTVAGREIDAYVAHNAKFDSAMVPMLNKKPWLCTYRLAKKLYPELAHHSNQFLRYELGLNVPEAKGLPAHRALADAHVTSALVKHLLDKVYTDRPATSLADLLNWINEPFLLTKCYLPKHKDKPWEQVVKGDPSYCQWILGPDFRDLDADTRYTIDHWQGIHWPDGWPIQQRRRY